MMSLRLPLRCAVAAALALSGACSNQPGPSGRPAARQVTQREVIDAATRGEAELRAQLIGPGEVNRDAGAELPWAWDDAQVDQRDDGHWVVRVYYESPLRGKIGTSFELDENLKVIASAGFSEG